MYFGLCFCSAASIVALEILRWSVCVIDGGEFFVAKWRNGQPIDQQMPPHLQTPRRLALIQKSVTFLHSHSFRSFRKGLAGR